jgi:hypothetical protein
MVYSKGMANTLTKPSKTSANKTEFSALVHRLVKERQRVEGLLREVDEALRKVWAVQKKSRTKTGPGVGGGSPRPSPLDQIRDVIRATADLRVTNGNLSAHHVAKLYGLSLSQLADWLGRSRQSLAKTPDADSIQNELGYFERVARLRLVTENDEEFRKWLRMPNDTLGNRAPLELLAAKQWQILADKVDDMLTGAPT